MNAIPFSYLALAVSAAAMAIAYWATFGIWFRTDDFAWLDLRNHWQFWPAMYTPLAQGTVRFLSERLLFWFFPAWFGIDPLPFRLLSFLTQIANCTLLAVLATRLGAGRMEALLTIPIWLLSTGVAISICWVSAYNQLLGSLCLLAALLAFVDKRTGLAWAAFLLGFGAIECNAVLPALLAAYCLIHARERWRETLPFFCVSAAYAVVWFVWMRIPSPEYGMVFDLRMPATLWEYLRLLFGLDAWIWMPALLVLPLAIWWRRARLGILWFLVTLGPYIPLREHVSDYYLVIPALGIALAVISLPAVPRWILAAVLLVCGWQTRTRAIDYYLFVTNPMESLVAGVVEVREKYPKATIVLDNVDPLLVKQGLDKRPWELFGVRSVYLAGEMEPAKLLDMLQARQAVVFRHQEGHLRNVTAAYGAVVRATAPGR